LLKTGSDSGGPPPEIINLEKELASMYRHVLRHREEMVEYLFICFILYLLFYICCFIYEKERKEKEKKVEKKKEKKEEREVWRRNYEEMVATTKQKGT
jgi:hypothetical protein